MATIDAAIERLSNGGGVAKEFASSPRVTVGIASDSTNERQIPAFTRRVPLDKPDTGISKPVQRRVPVSAIMVGLVS
jgi:hypothetical protein